MAICWWVFSDQSIHSLNRNRAQSKKRITWMENIDLYQFCIPSMSMYLLTNFGWEQKYGKFSRISKFNDSIFNVRYSRVFWSIRLTSLTSVASIDVAFKVMKSSSGDLTISTFPLSVRAFIPFSFNSWVRWRRMRYFMRLLYILP